MNIEPDKHAILIVDDDPCNLKLVAKHLEESGLEIFTAYNGETAIERAIRGAPDLILMDVVMPGFDGFETCRRLKANDVTKDIPVIFITALAKEAQIKGFEAGGVDYISTPIRREELLARVATHLRLRELTERLEQKIRKRTRELTAANQRLEQEIAERRQAEALLRENKQLLEMSQDIAHLGSYMRDIATDEIIWSREQYRIFGYEPGEVQPDFRLVLSHVHPDDTDKFVKNNEALVSANKPYDVIYRIIRKDGEKRTVRSKARLFTDKLGTPLTMQGALQDITEAVRTEAQIRRSLEEKELLLREIHHRVKNNMQVISSLLSLQSDKITDKRYAEMFKESEARIRSMALVYENLYQSESLANIDFHSYAESLINGLIRSYGVDMDRIKIRTEIENIVLDLDNSVPCGLIINELVSNAFKYAFPRGREGELVISLCSVSEDEFELIIADDGVGIPKDTDIRKADSLGLRLVVILAEGQLEGEIVLNREKGSEYRIRFRRQLYKKRIKNDQGKYSDCGR